MHCNETIYREGPADRCPPSLGIVADDLTGAMDTAGSFAAGGLTTRVMLSPSVALDGSHSCHILCYNTQTRNLAASEVPDAVRRATRLLVERGYPRLYKKIDSTMRGHVGLEVATMMEASGASRAFVCPAFPEMGRTVRDGVLYAGGEPLTQAQEGRDPLSPVASSSVVELLGEQTGFKVGLASVVSLESGDEALEKQVHDLIDQGCVLVVFDAARREHLELIAAIQERRYPEVLMVGSAGLASAVASRLGSVPALDLPLAKGEKSRSLPLSKGDKSGYVPTPRVENAPLLVVSGSLNQKTHVQLRQAELALHLRLVRIESAAILGSSARRDAELRRVCKETLDCLRRDEDVGLCWSRGIQLNAPTGPVRVAIGPSSVLLARDRLMLFLEEAVSVVVAEAALSGLVLVGGDTAYSVLSGLHADGVVLAGEIEPGIPLGTIASGDAHGKLVVTKAGGFGDKDTLVRVVNSVRPRPPP